MFTFGTDSTCYSVSFNERKKASSTGNTRSHQVVLSLGIAEAEKETVSPAQSTEIAQY